MKRATVLVIIGRYTDELYEKFKDQTLPEFSDVCRYTGGQLCLPMEPDSRELHHAFEYAESLGAHPTLFSRVVYTKQETEAHPWFCPLLPAPLELEGMTPARYGTQYTGGCPHCGLGAEPAGDVYVNSRFIRKCRMGVLEPGTGLFVSQDVKEMLEESGLTGFSFDRRLLDYKGRDMGEYYMMTIHHVLPPLSPLTFLNPDRVENEVCGHRITYLQSDLRYEAEKLEGAMDFNLTTEYLNNSRARELVISARARRVLQQNRVRVYRYEPVDLL